MILIGLLQKRFFKNLQTEKFPSHVISVNKQDLFNVQRIDFRYKMIEVNLTASKELSNLEALSEHTYLLFKNNNFSYLKPNY